VLEAVTKVPDDTRLDLGDEAVELEVRRRAVDVECRGKVE
jgi:hypothetical protein